MKTVIQSHSHRTMLLLILFIFSVWFRMWFISLAPQAFMFDQEEYQNYAAKMLSHPFLIAADSYRTYPYPMLLAVVYRVAGFGNHRAVYAIQAVMDSLVVLVVFFLLRLGFGFGVGAWIGAALYSINPFSSGYVGVILSEIMTLFWMAVAVLFGVLLVRSPGKWPLAAGLGFAAGLAAETRNASFAWAFIPLLFAVRWIPVRRSRILLLSMAAGFLLTVLYPLYTNWRFFGEMNISTVDNFFAKEFYNGVFLKRLPPFTYEYPEETKFMFFDYSSELHPERTARDRKVIAGKYMLKAWEKIWENPVDYLQTRFEKAWYVWQKENVFFYKEPWFLAHRLYTYLGNLVLLSLALLGLRRKAMATEVGTGPLYLRAVIIGSLLYATIAFSLTHAEYRLTIPFYPFLFVSSMLGIRWITTSGRNTLVFLAHTYRRYEKNARR